jgi:hypothetical protein
MNLSSRLVLLSLSLSLVPIQAQAQEEGGTPAWSLSTGRTVGAGGNAVAGEVGWPGIEARYVHGISDRFDVGARFAFLYGSIVGVNVSPALTFGGVLRAGLVRNGMVSLGLEFNPGIGFGFTGRSSFLVQFPLELQVGVHPSSLVSVVFAARLTPTFIVGFDSNFTYVMPIVLGPGVELFVAPDLAVTVSTRFGPGVWAHSLGSGVAFSFVATFGLGYRF